MNSVAIMTIDSLGIFATGCVLDKSIRVVPWSYSVENSMHPD